VNPSPRPVVLSDVVAEALRTGAPVLALESTIITHGLPQPQNLEAARQFEAAVAAHGAVPATIAVLDGVPRIGLEADELERVAGAGAAVKLSARDLPVAIAQGLTGGTTVAATAFLAAHNGLRVFATGGLGGVHRDAASTFDESADLGILARSRITVVSAGVKSILDVGATLERLETQGVLVVGYRTKRFPGFWLSESGHDVEHEVDSPEEIAQMMQAQDALGLPGALLVGNPLPLDRQLDPVVHDRVLGDALQAAAAASVRGKEITPFLLDWVHEKTDHLSLGVNIDIVLANAALGAEIAVAWSAL
jgi:pseudouridine-5'-phosphate glycosidase